MMHRRSLLGLFGFGAAAAVLPLVPVTAEPRIVTPTIKFAFPHIVEKPDTLFADVQYEGGHMYTVPATLEYRKRADRPYRDDLVATFFATLTGTVREVRLRRGKSKKWLCAFNAADFDSPNVVCGTTVQIRFGVA